jgi:hypothetical protein
MNDFTKEELENILNGNVEIYPSSYSELRNKIQSMIDNYCEHNHHTNHQSNCDICDECHKVIG